MAACRLALSVMYLVGERFLDGARLRSRKFDLHLFGEGNHYSIYYKLGAHPTVLDGLAGIDRLESFFASFDVPQRLRQVITEADRQYLEPISRMAVNDACNLTNPRPASWQEFLQICEEVW